MKLSNKNLKARIRQVGILLEIARALGVTADYLLGNEQDGNVIKDTDLLKYFKEVDKMPEELKGALMTVIEAYVQNFKAKQAYGA